MRLLGLNTIYALLCLCFRPSTPASSEPAMQPWKYAGCTRRSITQQTLYRTAPHTVRHSHHRPSWLRRTRTARRRVVRRGRAHVTGGVRLAFSVREKKRRRRRRKNAVDLIELLHGSSSAPLTLLMWLCERRRRNFGARSPPPWPAVSAAVGPSIRGRVCFV